MQACSLRKLSVVNMALAAWACAAEPSPDAVVRDSSGVRIVEIHLPPWTSPALWTIPAQPSLTIGGAEGTVEAQFDRIAGIVRLASGTIVVADAGSGQLRIFDERGMFVSAAGGPGGGPGEYRQIVSMGFGPGDSLWVYDFGVRRFTILDTLGRLIRTANLGGELSNVGAVGRLPNGAFVIREFWSSRSQQGETGIGLSRSRAAVAIVSAEGQVVDTVGLFEGREVYLGTEDGRTVMSAPPFARQSNVTLRNEHIVVGEQTRFEVAEYAPPDRLESLLRVPMVDLRLSAQDVESYVAQQISPLAPEEQTMRRQYLESLGVPETRPAYSDLKVDADGNLWVAEYVVPGQTPRRWAVFRPDGSFIGAVTVPERFSVFDIGTDWILGVWRDVMDVEHVRLYPIDKVK